MTAAPGFYGKGEKMKLIIAIADLVVSAALALASAAGSPRAKIYLGFKLLAGLGGERDYKDASRLFEKAAAQGRLKKFEHVFFMGGADFLTFKVFKEGTGSMDWQMTVMDRGSPAAGSLDEMELCVREGLKSREAARKLAH